MIGPQEPPRCHCHFCGIVMEGVEGSPTQVRYCKVCTDIRSFVRYAICPDGVFTTTNDGLHDTFVPKLEKAEEREQRETEGRIVRDLGQLAARIKQSNYQRFATHRKQAIQILIDYIMCSVRGEEAVYHERAITKMMDDFTVTVIKRQRGL